MDRLYLRRARHRVALCAILVCAVVVGVVSSSNGSTGASPTAAAAASKTTGVDVGNGIRIPLTLKKIKLAFIASGLQTPLGVSQKKWVERVAKRYGIHVTTFDGQLLPTRQFSIYQTVIGSGKFNAIVTLPTGGQQHCDILSKTAPKKKIVVAIVTLPICGRELKSSIGNGLWSPGTLITVGVNSNHEGLRNQARTCAKVTGGGKIALLNGFAGTPNNRAMTAAYTASGMNIVANYATNYTSEDAYAKISAILRTEPDLKVIATTFPALTYGAIQAVKSAGKTPGKDVKLCSFTGGGQRMLDLVKSGEVSVDAYTHDGWAAAAATQAIIDAVRGKPVPRVAVPGLNGAIVKSDGKWPPVYTKATVGKYKATGE